jgi:F420-non-reducing hydrogenase iron-sulfur subunit
MEDEQFEPKIVAFLCRWCAYTGADLAGTNRASYPSTITPIRVMCSGRVDPTLIIKALADGADGVLIAGCHLGDCHYVEGNYKTLRRYPALISLLEQFGIERDRIRLEWISASEGDVFAEVVKDLTDRLKKLGPLNWNGRPPVATTSEATELQEVSAHDG